MAIRIFGHATITLPELDEPGLYLSNVDSLDSSRGTVQDFAYGDADLRSLDLAQTQLVTGRIAGTDLRENDLPAIRGLANLAKVRIAPASSQTSPKPS